MRVESCIEKIEKRNHRNTQRMLFVNVNNDSDLKSIKEHFEFGYRFINVAEDGKDEMPKLDEICSIIESPDEVVFIEGISSYLRLRGQKRMQTELNQLLDAQSSSKAVILLYQCDDILHEAIGKDPRLESVILFVDGDRQELPKIIFVKDKVLDSVNYKYLCGISSVIKRIESVDSAEIYVKSHFSRDDFPESLYVIGEIGSFFEIVRNDFLSSLSVDDETLLNEEQWHKFAEGCKKNSGAEGYFHKIFGDEHSVNSYINSWAKLSDEKKVLLYISIKKDIVRCNNNILQLAISNCPRISDFPVHAYKSLLLCDQKGKDYWSLYEERRDLILAIGTSEHLANEYCNIVETKGASGLYFLTDLTKAERKLTIKLIALYADQIERKDILSILKHTYKDLWAYLRKYDYKIKDIEKYFDEYKWLKVENLISQSFLERVEIEAKERNFYRILPPRSEQLGKLKKENSILYFLDALGVEYLSFIAQKAAELHLMMNVIICHSELPSITSMNKEFVDVFKQANADVRDNIKELDDIKHSGTLEYNYAKSIYPTYLADELSIISDVLEKIDADITSTYERAYIISDHGASRLAVLKHSETKWEMLNKGEHCGRCCKKSDNVVDVPNEYMTEDNGYWVLANYDMFKGGRPGTVEVHGGATLEEVCVPIIEFTRMPENINVEVITKTVKTGYKIKPLLQFVTNCKLHNVKVLIGEREYLAQSDDDLHFTAELQGLRIEKEYMFEVVADGNIRIENLKFRLKSSGIIDNDIL